MPGNFAYSHGLNDQVYYPDVPADGTAARQQFMDLFTEIKDNMNNNLAQQTDLATKANQTDLTAHLAENATDAHNATAISVADTAGHFTGTEVEAVLAELFTFANSGKQNWVDVIGSPLLNTDAFATLKSKTQTAKNTLAANLTAKGQTSVGTETLTALAAKVASVTTTSVKKVQRGYIASISALSQSISISTIVPANSIIIVETDANNGPTYDKLSAEIISSTSIKLTRNDGTMPVYRVIWTVIEFENVKSKQIGQVAGAGSSVVQPVTIAAINIDKAILITASKSTGTSYTSSPNYIEKGRIVDSTTLNIYAETNNTVFWQVIEFN